MYAARSGIYDPDNEIPIAAVTQDPWNLQYVSLVGTVSLDYVVHYAVSLDGAVLQFAHGQQNNPALVLTAVSSNGHALEYAAQYLKDNFIVVSRAVTTCWRALRHASSRMATDERVLNVATRHMRLCDKCRLSPSVTNELIREDWSWYFPNKPLPDHWGHMDVRPFFYASPGWSVIPGTRRYRSTEIFP